MKNDRSEESPELIGTGLRYFEPSEFDLTAYGGENWWDRMSPELLQLLDRVRGIHGDVIEISPHPRALGRYGEHISSDHAFDRWQEVRAADIFPAMPQNPESAMRFLDACLEAGVSAIGVYPHWTNRHGNRQTGFHIGYRPERIGNPAKWGLVLKDNGLGKVTLQTSTIAAAINQVGRA